MTEIAMLHPVAQVATVVGLTIVVSILLYGLFIA